MGLRFEKRVETSLHFFSFQERCNPNVYDDDGVRLYSPGASLPLTFLQILVFGADSLSLFGDGVIAVTMCYMLYRRSSGLTRQ